MNHKKYLKYNLLKEVDCADACARVCMCVCAYMCIIT